MKFARPVKRISQFHTSSKMHWSFYIYALVALAGWSVGHVVSCVTRPPAWLVQ